MLLILEYLNTNLKNSSYKFSDFKQCCSMTFLINILKNMGPTWLDNTESFLLQFQLEGPLVNLKKKKKKKGTYTNT